jgi:hypothetical protein
MVIIPETVKVRKLAFPGASIGYFHASTTLEVTKALLL